MHLTIDKDHDITLSSAGKVLRFEEGDVDGFLCYADISRLQEAGFPIPEQFLKTRFACDLEIYDDTILTIHQERAFKTREKALAWFRYAAWCLAHLHASDICHLQRNWELS